MEITYSEKPLFKCLQFIIRCRQLRCFMNVICWNRLEYSGGRGDGSGGNDSDISGFSICWFINRKFGENIMRVRLGNNRFIQWAEMDLGLNSVYFLKIRTFEKGKKEGKWLFFKFYLLRTILCLLLRSNINLNFSFRIEEGVPSDGWLKGLIGEKLLN